VAVAEAGEEITMDRAAVALKKELLGSGRGVRRTAMGLA
jgi:hypothetical protein